MTSEGPSPTSSSIDHLNQEECGIGDMNVGAQSVSKTISSSTIPPTVSVPATIISPCAPGSVEKKHISSLQILPVGKSTSEGSTRKEFIKMPGTTNGLAGKLIPATSVCQNVAYLGTYIGKDSFSQKVLVTPVKGKDGLTRIILPRSVTAATAITSNTSTATAASTGPVIGSISLSVVPKRKSIVLSSKTAIPFDSTATSTAISSKPNIIRHKSGDKVFANSLLKNVIHAPVKPNSTAPPKVVYALAPTKVSEISSTSNKVDSEEKIVQSEITPSPPSTDKTDASKNDSEATAEKQPPLEPSSTTSDDVINGHPEKDASASSETAPAPENVQSNSTDKSDPVNSVPTLVTTSTTAPLSPVVDRARKRKGQVAATCEPVLKMLPQQQENVKILPGAEEINPFKVLEWDPQGVGVIPDSDIKMFVNDYGMLEIHEETLAQRGAKSTKRDPKNIYCCISCGCYGLLQEFFNENFCSIACRDKLNAKQQAICLKIEQTAKEMDVGDSSISKDDDSYNFESDIVEEEVEIRSEEHLSTSGKHLNRMKAELNHLAKSSLVGRPLNKSLHGLSNKLVRGGTRLTDDDRHKYLLAQDLDPGLSLKNDLNKRKEELLVLDKPFPWADYLAHVRGRPAWVKLFNNPFPQSTNNFKIGYKLEAIDPEHQSYFCVVTVVAVKGHRIKLHFDNYPKLYDFWINVDSPNIFPCGFCARHGIQLQPPLGIKKANFSWHTYNAMQKARAAPMTCFPNYRTNNTCTNLFRVGMKLEAVDRKNTFLVCVATISGVIDNRILVHFDTWSDIYDCWFEITSPYIHPVGWCEANNRTLTPPNGYRIADFKWDKYLKVTGAVVAPEAAFPLRPPLEFKRGTKLEAVDRRAPHLLRVATIKETLPYQVKIAFDGFPDHFGFWTDDDSPDIHPVGWSTKTGHPLTFPPNYKEGARGAKSNCTTPCCRGDGHFKGLISETHDKVQDCPYSMENINTEHHLTNRLDKTDKRRRTNNNLIGIDGSGSDSDEENSKYRWAFMDVRQQEAMPRKRLIREKDMKKLERAKKTTASPVKRKLSEDAKPPRDMNGTVETIKRAKTSDRTDKDVMTEPPVKKDDKIEPDVSEIIPDPVSWTVKDVVDNIKSLVPSAAEIFEREEICGLSLLALSQCDLLTDFELESANANKIYTKISSLRAQVKAVSFD